jgi:Coenzyme PQQ synthesis protein D (PqqD)
MVFQSGTIVSWGDRHQAAEVDGEVVLLNLSDGHYFGLDEVGSTVWRFLEVPISVDKLCAALQTRYIGPKDKIVQDVLVLLEDLHEHGLLKVSA